MRSLAALVCAAADGDSVCSYRRQPIGLQAFAVRIGPDGLVREVVFLEDYKASGRRGTR